MTEILSQQRPRRVFLLDTHDIFRAGVRSVLDTEPAFEVVGESGSFADGVQQIVESGPDVALVGIRESEHGELGPLGLLRRARPDVGVLVLTSTDQALSLAAAAKAGARGYLRKDLSVHELTSAVDAVARGEDLLDHQRARKALAALARQSRPAPPDPIDSLTPQERKILALLADGLSNKQIADRLFLVEKTVRNHVTRILAKLGVQRRTQAALLAARRDTGD